MASRLDRTSLLCVEEIRAFASRCASTAEIRLFSDEIKNTLNELAAQVVSAADRLDAENARLIALRAQKEKA